MARPKGLPKTGGRQKGVTNKATAAKIAEVEASGLTPLDYMLTRLRDENLDHEIRMDAAKAAAPYCHARLAAVDANVNGDLSLTVVLNKP